jgi:hypothetical protein
MDRSFRHVVLKRGVRLTVVAHLTPGKDVDVPDLGALIGRFEPGAVHPRQGILPIVAILLATGFQKQEDFGVGPFDEGK